MELVEPIVRASTYDEPKLQTFLARCGAHSLNESFQCDGRATAGVEWKGAWPERRQQLLSSCQVGYGTKAFRAYERDISIKDGAELLFYFEAVWGPENRKTRKYFRNGGYNVFDAKQCDLMGTVGTHDPHNYFRNVPLRNVNGLLLYKGKHYVLDMYEIDGTDRDPEKPHYRMAVTGVGDRIEPVCSFSTFPKRSRN